MNALPIHLRYEEDDIASEEMHTVAEQGKSFDFLANEGELYSDDDLKVRY